MTRKAIHAHNIMRSLNISLTTEGEREFRHYTMLNVLECKLIETDEGLVYIDDSGERIAYHTVHALPLSLFAAWYNVTRG